MPLYNQVKISISFLCPGNGKLFDSQKKNNNNNLCMWGLKFEFQISYLIIRDFIN